MPEPRSLALLVRRCPACHSTHVRRASWYGIDHVERLVTELTGRRMFCCEQCAERFADFRWKRRIERISHTAFRV